MITSAGGTQEAGEQGPAAGRRQAPAGRTWPAGSAPPPPGFRGRPPRPHLPHAERENPDGVRRVPAGKPTVREAESPSGRRKAREANAGGREAAGNREPDAGPSASGSRITGRIGQCPARKSADAGLVSLRRKDVMTPEPRGKLDTVQVNGPEDDPDWDSVDWGQAEENVRRLRRRIFAASQAGDLKKARSLQKLMLRSRSNALVSVRRVTEINAGRKTAGVDGRIVLASWEKADLATWLQRGAAAWRPRPVKRVYVPKSNGRRRGPGIPVIADRALQALAVNALEPEWEARFEPRSYGFRPGRSCQDAIAAIFWTVAGRRTKRRWVLDADLTAAFDRVGHDHILDQLGTFPAKAAVAGWLKAGVIDKGRLAPTEQGTPQGGVASPLLFNIALHGMEQAAGAVYRWNPYREAYGAAPGTPLLVRYADDLIALCDSREQAQQVKTRLAEWLAPKGLAFNEDKTRIVSLDDGVDFLGFNIRRYGDKLLIKPSTAAIRCVRKRLAAEVKALRGANAAAVLRALNPIVRGWAAYCVPRGRARSVREEVRLVA